MKHRHVVKYNLSKKKMINYEYNKSYFIFRIISKHPIQTVIILLKYYIKNKQ